MSLSMGIFIIGGSNFGQNTSLFSITPSLLYLRYDGGRRGPYLESGARVS